MEIPVALTMEKGVHTVSFLLAHCLFTNDAYTNGGKSSGSKYARKKAPPKHSHHGRGRNSEPKRHKLLPRILLS
jgi:hypothetical protein